MAMWTPVELHSATTPSPVIKPLEALVTLEAGAPAGRKGGGPSAWLKKGIRWATEETVPKLPSSKGLDVTLLKSQTGFRPIHQILKQDAMVHRSSTDLVRINSGLVENKWETTLPLREERVREGDRGSEGRSSRH